MLLKYEKTKLSSHQAHNKTIETRLDVKRNPITYLSAVEAVERVCKIAHVYGGCVAVPMNKVYKVYKERPCFSQSVRLLACS